MHARTPHPRTRARALIALVAAAALATSSPTAAHLANAQTPPDQAAAVELLPLFGAENDPLSPALSSVRARSAELDAAVAAYDATAQRLQSAAALLESMRARLVVLDTQEARIASHLQAARARQRTTGEDVTRHEAVLRELALDAFTGSGGAMDLLDPDATTETQRRRGLSRTVANHEVRWLNRSRLAHDEARREVALAADRRARLREQQVRATAVRDAAQTESFLAAVQLAEERTTAHRARAEATVTGLDLSMVALDAYVLAAHRINQDHAGCRVSWAALAGIGRVESRHGTYRGSRVQYDGAVDPPIIGVALTGSDGVAFVPDSDGGRYDGDPVFDRAVGPMQFIPSSWRIYGRDGNGDGEKDPNNYYDAALAAGEHLCLRHRGLDDVEALRVALFSYNRSEAYGIRVIELAQQYAAERLPLRNEYRPIDAG